MKWILLLTLLVSLFFSLGCGTNQTQAAELPQQDPAPTQSTYDMLDWMTLSPDLRADHHLAGTSNPLYTAIDSDRFWWTKTGQGYPWDIQLYDDNYIYLWITELDWHDSNTFKMFRSSDPKRGNFNLPMVRRFAQAGFPGDALKISDSRFEIHTGCQTYSEHFLGHVINELWGPYEESLGGDLPPKLQTLVISYRYNCDSNYGHCGDKESFHLGKPYGLVYWQHQKLAPDGVNYLDPDNKTTFNRVVAGGVKPIFTCTQF